MKRQSVNLASTVLAAAASILVVAGCGRETTAAQQRTCSAPVVAVSPAAPELGVGDSLGMAAAYITAGDPCNPAVPAAALRWATTDPTLATVDSVRGLVTAVRKGNVGITVHEADSARVLGTTVVHAYTPLYGRIIFTKMLHSSYAPYPCPSGTGTCPPALWTMAPDGSDQELLLDSLNYPESPRIAPDGRTVVFEDWGLLYTVDAAGLGKHQIATGLANNYRPTWSHDGRWIMFYGWPSGGTLGQVYQIHPDGTGLRQLTSGPLGGYSADWSPDGSSIVFMQEVLDTLGQLAHWQAAVMDSGGGNMRLLKAWGCCYTVMDPAWSPGGGTILVIGPGGSNWGIGRLRLSDTSYVVLADAQGNRPGEWSPDGSTIVYGTGDIWLMNADGSGQRDVLTDAFINMEASWGPAAPAHASPARAAAARH
ncbi:MAG TPA: Ig-like domain-containing protein [Gemmatimonadales bacterium]|nr:Ig-like domain-containing protein [Gemmatimonadales bacterium]